MTFFEGLNHRALNRRSAIQLKGDANKTLALAHGRVVVLKGFFLLFFFLVAVRATDLSVLQKIHVDRADVEVAQLPIQEQEAVEAVHYAKRGRILDRNGVVLATTLKTASLFADPYLISDPENAARELSKIFPDVSYGALLKDLQSKKRFVWVKRSIMPDEQLKVLELGEPGLAFREENRRFYPQEELAAHLLGYTNVDLQGIAGLEKSFDRMMAEGKDIRLSLDVRLQHVLRREIMKAAADFDAIAGVGAIMDVHTGEILAGVSWPDFNPNMAGDANSNSLFNRLTVGTYELGSVFKIFSTAAFLDKNNVPMSTKFDASNPIKAGRFMINDYHAEDRVLTIPEVFMYSSNIGSAMMGQAVGTEGLQNFYRDLGLLDALELEVPESASPIVPNPWREVSTLTASYGHGLATTPMHVVRALSIVANGGYLVNPRLVLQEEEPANGAGQVAVSVISEETSAKMRSLLRLVVAAGTGRKADVEGFYVGGKTGTAEKPGKGGYDRSKLISSFAGIFPAQDPKYAIFIAIDEPKGNKASYGYATAGWVAAPAMARVVKGIANITGMPSETVVAEHDIAEPLKQYVAFKKH